MAEAKQANRIYNYAKGKNGPGCDFCITPVERVLGYPGHHDTLVAWDRDNYNDRGRFEVKFEIRRCCKSHEELEEVVEDGNGHEEDTEKDEDVSSRDGGSHCCGGGEVG